MAKNYFHGDITSSSTDWATGDESTNNLPCSGESVQRYIKSRLAEISEKPSYGDFTGSQLRFFSNEGDETPLFTIGLSTTIYLINITSQVDGSTISGNFTVLSSDTEKIVTISATTQEGTIGGSSYTDVTENYNYVISIDSGNGYMQRYSGTFNHGESASFDIKPYLSFGDNRLKVTVTGQDSQTTKSAIYIATVTSLSLNITHSWWTPWIGGESYSINNIRFSGNVEKTLHVTLDGTEVVTETYSSSTSYTTTSTNVVISSSDFPEPLDESDESDASLSGIHVVRIWMTSGSGANEVSTQAFVYNIMCIDASETSTAKLICLNNVVPAAVNFTTPTLFSYATYNVNAASFNVTIVDTNPGKSNTTIYNSSLSVEFTQTEYPFTIQLDYDSEATTNLNLSVMASVTDGNTQSLYLPIDNSNAYIATAGAWFQIKPALRDNAEEGKTNFINVIDGTSYAAVWSNNFGYVRDGWYKDNKGYSALVIPAGATIGVKEAVTENGVTTYNTTLHLIPQLEVSTATGYTLEFMLKSGYPSGYENPIFSIANNDLGLYVYPTELVLKNSANQQASVIFKENSVTHVVITWQRNYASNFDGNHHLCTIYINGVNNASFQYSGNATWGYGTLEMGQQDTDTYLYMIRAYNTALEHIAVKNNYLNAMIDGAEVSRTEAAQKNAIVDGNSISYDLVKAAGFNTMVVEMLGTAVLPDFNHQSGGLSNVRFEYADHPSWNTSITYAPIDGQGTTSKQYYRWNLRWKLTKYNADKGTEDSIWHYADGSTSIQNGFFDGQNRHPEVSKIVAKTNYASSMQGHKMGACDLYNDLAAKLGIYSANSIPSDSRSAIYQYPFFGFEYNSTNNEYRFIGLFTAGPDKGDKGTFVFNKSTYPSLLSLEGPNHAPLATRFLTPWMSNNVAYDSSQETITFNGEEGWDVAFAGPYSTDKSSDASNILTLAESEWKPAYDFVFYHSPYIVPLSSTGYNSISALNAAITTFRGATSTIVVNGVQRTIKNELVQIYDSSYNLYGYVNGAYVSLNYNLVGKFGITNSSDQADIIAKRGADFATNIGDYFDKDWAVYHWCFCVLFALTDNFAKNSYPIKYKTWASGGRWAWRQDDMDTIFATDNNGNQTKAYDVEHGDTVLGVEVFQGGSSVFWTLVRDYLQSDIASMFVDIDDAFDGMATTLNVGGEYHWKRTYNVVDYYFWAQSAQYFGINGYNFDRDFKYIQPWVEVFDRTYNNVLPLTQALGDQYQCERQWVERRLAYIYSKYRLDGMTGSTTGFGRAEFTLANDFTFNFTPAINYYPVCAMGSTDYPSVPTKVNAGSTIAILLAANGTTTNYLNGLNYLTNLGDLHKMELSTRGASEQTPIPFSITSDRLQILQLGRDLDESDESDDIDFNAQQLSVSNCYSLVTLNARGVASIKKDLDLKTCPRLRDVYLDGTNIPNVLIATGSRIETLYLPATLQALWLNNMPCLTTLSLDSWSGIRSVYMSNLQHLNQTGKFFEFIESVLYNKTQASPIVTDAYYISWFDLLTENMTPEQFSTFSNFAQLVVDNPNDFGWVEYNNAGDTYNNRTGNVVLSGHMDKGYINFKDIFSDLTYETAYVKFKDPVMHKLCLDIYQASATVNSVITSSKDDADTAEANIPSNVIYTRYDVYDGTTWQETYLLEDILLSTIENVTSFASLRDWDATKKAAVTSFDELQYFSGLTGNTFGAGSAVSSVYRGCFYNFTNMTSVKLPPNITGLGDGVFNGCTSLTSITIPSNITSFRQHVFFGCTGLETVIIEPRTTNITWGGQMFSGCTSLANVYVDDINWWAKQHNSGSSNCYIFWANALDHHVYVKGTEVTNAVLSGITQIARYAFNKCVNLTSVVIPEGVTFIGQYAFGSTGISSLTLPKSVTTIELGSFDGCGSLTSLTIEGGETVHTITFTGNNSFRNCSSITTVRLGKVNVNTRSETFGGCTNVESVYLSDLSSYLGSVIQNNSNFLTSTTKNVKIYLNDSEITTLNVPNDVTSIPQFSFRGCTGITSVTLPNTVTNVYYSAFYKCSGLVTVDLGTGVTVIADNAFRDCTNLESITMPNAISCSSNTFSGCSKLTDIYITNISNWCASSFATLGNAAPNYANTLSKKMYVNNVKVTDLVIPNNVTTIKAYIFSRFDFTSITVPNSVTTIGDYAFADCSSMSSISLPSSITSLGQLMFRGCNSLHHLRFPDSITTVPKEILNNNTGIKTCVVGDHVTSIAGLAFRSCSSMTALYMLPTTPPTLADTNVLLFNTCQIYVPESSLSTYQGYTNWTSFSSRMHGVTYEISNGVLYVRENGTLIASLDNLTGIPVS